MKSGNISDQPSLVQFLLMFPGKQSSKMSSQIPESRCSEQHSVYAEAGAALKHFSVPGSEGARADIGKSFLSLLTGPETHYRVLPGPERGQCVHCAIRSCQDKSCNLKGVIAHVSIDVLWQEPILDTDSHILLP